MYGGIWFIYVGMMLWIKRVMIYCNNNNNIIYELVIILYYTS